MKRKAKTNYWICSIILVTAFSCNLFAAERTVIASKDYGISFLLNEFNDYDDILLAERVKRAVETEKKNTDEKAEISPKEPDTPVVNYSMKIGVKSPFMLPLGDLSEMLGPGFGATVYGDFPLIYLTDYFVFKAGFDIGFVTMSGTGDSAGINVSMIPVLVYGNFTYKTSFGLDAYFNLGTGITTLMLKGDTSQNDISDGTSVDGTIMAGLGVAYTHRALKGVEFMAEVSYLLALEKVAGSFLSVSIGAAYRLDFGWSGFNRKNSAAGEINRAESR